MKPLGETGKIVPAQDKLNEIDMNFGQTGFLFIYVVQPNDPKICWHMITSLQWRYNEYDGVSNHRSLDC